MPRYIDAETIPALFNEKFKETQKLIEAGETQLDNLAEGFAEAEKIVLFKAPTADVHEAKHGRWLFGRFGYGWCSECHECGLDTSELDAAGNYCPNCGAKMDLEPEERKKFDEQIH